MFEFVDSTEVYAKILIIQFFYRVISNFLNIRWLNELKKNNCVIKDLLCLRCHHLRSILDKIMRK